MGLWKGGKLVAASEAGAVRQCVPSASLGLEPDAIYFSRHSLRECSVKLKNSQVLLEIHVSFAERTTPKVSKVDGIGLEPVKARHIRTISINELL